MGHPHCKLLRTGKTRVLDRHVATREAWLDGPAAAQLALRPPTLPADDRSLTLVRLGQERDEELDAIDVAARA